MSRVRYGVNQGIHMTIRLLPLLALIACGVAPLCERCPEEIFSCVGSDQDSLIVCRQNMNACLGRAADAQDVCFAYLAVCLQSDTIPRRECFEREARCLSCDGGTVP